MYRFQEVDCNDYILKEVVNMHSYLRAIGFSNVKSRSDFEKILGIVMEQPSEKNNVDLANKVVLCEMKRDFMKNMGIGIVGEYDERVKSLQCQYFQ